MCAHNGGMGLSQRPIARYDYVPNSPCWKRMDMVAGSPYSGCAEEKLAAACRTGNEHHFESLKVVSGGLNLVMLYLPGTVPIHAFSISLIVSCIGFGVLPLHFSSSTRIPSAFWHSPSGKASYVCAHQSIIPGSIPFWLI
jgi:hypothetical protein